MERTNTHAGAPAIIGLGRTISAQNPGVRLISPRNRWHSAVSWRQPRSRVQDAHGILFFQKFSFSVFSDTGLSSFAFGVLPVFFSRSSCSHSLSLSDPLPSLSSPLPDALPAVGRARAGAAASRREISGATLCCTRYSALVHLNRYRIHNGKYLMAHNGPSDIPSRFRSPRLLNVD